MNDIAAVVACGILGLLALFQIALALGAPLGEFAWGGKAKVLPAKLRIGSIVSVLLYAVIAIIFLERAEITHFVGSVAAVHVAAWVVFGYFVLGVLMNAVSRSKRERFTMTPVTIVLPTLALIVALS